ncbi:MAG: IS21 family transposase [Longimicrobiales bacterium]
MKKITSGDELAQRMVLESLQGASIHRLHRQYGISRNTVRRILRDHTAQREQGHDVVSRAPRRASKLDPFRPRIQEILERYPKITGTRLFEKLREEEGYTGGISIVRELLVQLRPPPRKQAIIRFETQPGQQGQMDWSPYTLHFRRTGTSKVLCFSYILGFSRRHYIDFTLNRNFHTLIRRHRDAFGYFDGVPLECLYDNEKTVVLRWEAGRPVYNPAFTAFITHYRCKPIACRPRHPQTKGKIEAPFRYIESNLLGGREFDDLEELRRIARWWLSEKSDRHIHDTTRQSPLERFALERPHLQPLPPHAYDTSEVALRVCRDHGFVELDTNTYSVPSGHVGDILTVKATEHEVFVYSPELELLARHERAPRGLAVRIQNPDHFQPKKARYGLEPVREVFLALGEAAEQFLDGLVQRYPRQCGAHVRYVLRLKEQYRAEDIHDALRHALRYGAYDAQAVERILHVRFAPRTLESIRNERASRALEQTLPEVRQRPLDEYGALFTQPEEAPGGERQNAGSNPGSPEDAEPDGDPETARP